MGATYHILPYTPHGWAIYRTAAKRNSCFAPTRKSAEKIANGYLKSGRASIVYIHDNNGRIIDYFPRKELI